MNVDTMINNGRGAGKGNLPSAIVWFCNGFDYGGQIYCFRLTVFENANILFSNSQEYDILIYGEIYYFYSPNICLQVL